MPRRKKSEQTPTGVSGGPLPGQNVGLGPLQGYSVALASNLSPSEGGSHRQKITQEMQEIFPHLDPEVIHIVLSEVDFKVENATDSLLELSIAAELAAPVGSPVSGFESTAAALLSPGRVSQPAPDGDSSEASQRLTSPLSTSLLTEEVDLQVDQELQNLEDRANGHYLSAAVTRSSLPPPQFPEQIFPELLQFDREPECGRGSAGRPYLEEGSVRFGPPPPFDRLNTWEGGSGEGQKSVVDFTHLMTEEPADRPKPPLDLLASRRPSAFQMYKKESSQILLEQPGPMPSENKVRGLSSPVTTGQWKLHSPAFPARLHGSQGPCFITPIAPSHRPIGHPTPWEGQGAVPRAPLRHSATIPKSWTMAATAHNPVGVAPALSSELCLEGKVLVLLRGPPGSGKSTLARAFLEHNPGGVALSTDDYFTLQGRYHFDPAALGEAHEWNHKMAKEAFERGANPIVIDNTNMQGWEMKPYVAQALKHYYKVLFRETDTWWKNKPRELERRSKHGVTAETIRRMLNGYERFVTVKSIMGAVVPNLKQRLHLDNKNLQCVTPEAKCPDLVSEPGLMDQRKHSQPHLFSSLPDVSSNRHPSELRQLEDDEHKSTDSLVFQPIGRLSERLYENVNLDLWALDSDLDALTQSGGEQGVPDCIVESVMNAGHRSNELPVAFSESIKQRVPRERPTRKFDSANLVKDMNHSNGLAMEREQNNKEAASVVASKEGEMSKMLHFVGDWPAEGPLEQRQERRKERSEDSDGSEDRRVSKDVNNDTGKVQSGTNLTEFQKLLDLIQTGVVTCQSGSPCASPVCLSLGQDLEKDDKIEESLSCRSELEEKEQKMNAAKSGRVDLPDCVLDWKASESYKGNEEIVKSENETSRATVLDIGCETESDAAADTRLAISTSESTEPKESHSIEHDYHTEFASASNTQRDTNKCKEQTDNEMTVQPDSRHSSDLCHGPVARDSVEPESCVLSGSSLERKQRHGRRSGKQCKLALTFSQNCLAPSLEAPECPITTSQILDNAQSSNTAYPDCDSILMPKLFPKLKEEVHLRTDSPVSSDRGCPTQTEPQDFALLWRLNRQDGPADTLVAACSYSSDVTILCGVSSRFVPEVASAVSAAIAVHPSTHNTVPYRMVHEKSTQVEDKELGAVQSRLESLSILSRHFKLVSLDTLEDLFDKCHQDLEWTTNLLLDSGESLFRDEDVLEEIQEDEAVKVEQNTSLLVTVLETNLGDDLPSPEPTAVVSAVQQSANEVVNEIGGTSDTDSSRFGGTASPIRTKNQPDTHSHTVTTSTLEKCDDIEHKMIIEESSFATPDDIASLEEVHRLLQVELEDMEREERQKKNWRANEKRVNQVVNIQSVELRLPTELALQLTELFGPVGVEPGICASEDYAVQMDMNLAKLLHHKWKETIQERQKKATLSHQLFLDDAGMPMMDHWNVSQPCVSLRDIIKEELAMQENMEKSRQNRADLSRRDGASVLKEDQLYSCFPSIDRLFLQDIFRDHNYCLSQTELFLNSLLDQDPVKTVVAPELPQSDHHRTTSKEREKRQTLPDPAVADSQNYQDIEDPEYKDFRAEASLQRSRQLESFSKAAEAYKQGLKEVASFYANQGHLHGQRMREANHRAAVQIFERANSSLLPKNIVNLHGLHVDEALEHLGRILHDKTADCEQGLCRPQLSVITGRGNHSQGGVARIRPAVINYLKSTRYRFTEPKPGLVVVSLR
ncbi:NEDD4-binding protein 2 isoform X1 [Phycodurus eques]|uniref:NEDD4-binding protein 2 isoform X1 n=1 Tax=Phycodurus eques TaxID=693459 RepID=UPI002ACDB7C9|nr:NEDD4-binding protein 2 isoform X1 [Phycodurus eques]